MKKIFNKDKLLEQKKKYLFLLIIMGIGFISGIIFLLFISKNDKEVLFNELNNFFNNIKNNNLNYINTLVNSTTNNIFSIALIWLLGISIIGIPFIIIFLFYKSFTLGFSISAIIAKYGIKGIFLSFTYTFPHQLIYLLIWLLICFYALSFALKIINILFFKKNINLRENFKKYVKIFVICILASIICSLFETYITPNIIKLFIS